tara:strand:- start:180 stop:356 length:177 start_codon:yes stop_codon:yes gene_type:complete
MKVIKNDSCTGREITIKTPKGPSTLWIKPNEQVMVPPQAISNTINNLAKRRILKITNA